MSSYHETFDIHMPNDRTLCFELNKKYRSHNPTITLHRSHQHHMDRSITILCLHRGTRAKHATFHTSTNTEPCQACLFENIAMISGWLAEASPPPMNTKQCNWMNGICATMRVSLSQHVKLNSIPMHGTGRSLDNSEFKDQMIPTDPQCRWCSTCKNVRLFLE